MQVEAERRKRAAILESEGVREAEVNFKCISIFIYFLWRIDKHYSETCEFYHNKKANYLCSKLFVVGSFDYPILNWGRCQ